MKRIPLAVIIPAVYPAVKAMLRTGTLEQKILDMQLSYTGVDAIGEWHWDNVRKTYTGVLIGMMAHKLFGKTVNRYLPKEIPIGL